MKGGLRLRLLLADAMGLCVEGASIGLPVYLLYGVKYGRAAPPEGDVQMPGTEVLQLGGQVTRPVLLALVAFSVVYAVWQETRLRRLRQYNKDRASLGDLPPRTATGSTARATGSTAPATGKTALAPAAGKTAAEEVYLLAATLPRDTLWVRTSLWAACGVFCAAWLRLHGLPLASIPPLIWIFSFNPLLAGALHSLVYDRLLWGTHWRALPKGPDPMRRFASRYTAELTRAVLLTTLMALLCTVGFTISVPFDLEQFQRAQRYLPGLFFLLLYLGYRYGTASCRPIRAYLNAALSGDARAKEAGPLLSGAFRAAQVLPYRLGAAMVASSVVAAVVLLGIFMPLLDLPRESLVLILGVALSVTTGASLYAMVWHRATLRPLLSHLQELRAFDLGHPGHPDAVRAPLSLMGKMVGGFGLLVACTCVLSLLWSFVQCKTLATHQIQRLARDRLDTLMSELSREAARGAQIVPVEVAGLLRRLSRQAGIGKECLIYYLPDGAAAAEMLDHPASMVPPSLPAYSLSLLRQRLSGQLDIPRLRLTGEYQRLSTQGPDSGRTLGTLAVLYPDYLHPGFSGTDESPLRGQLLALVFFFVVLVFVSGGVVVIAAVDLARPVRYLERRAAAMAEGELNLPVVQTAVETDEVGRLTFAFEEMRRALSEKLRSSTQLNLRLEAEVARRTAELSRRNAEVSEALSKLRLTRDELLRTEKLATMGRIAAGVTSEINNPVNAMSTLPDPMSDELDELGRLSAQRPLPRQKVAATLGELQQMVDVLLRGAQRAKEIVRATRVYVRTGDDRAGPLDPNQVLDEVLQLFADLPRYGVSIAREYGENLRVATARSDLAQLLSSFLARITPRLRDVHRESPLVTLRARTRRLADGQPGSKPGRIEVAIGDDGPLLPRAELQAFAESDLLRRFGGQVKARSQATPAGNETSLVLVLEPAPG